MKKSFLLGAVVALTATTPVLAEKDGDTQVLLPWKYNLPETAATVIDPGQQVPIALPAKKAEIAKPPPVACGEVGRWTIFFPTSECSGRQVLGLRKF